MEANYASKQLMDSENIRLRAELFAKKNKAPKQRVGGAGACHMTNDETLDALAFVDWKTTMALLFTEFNAHEKQPSQPATFDSSSNSAATAHPGVQPTAYNFPTMGGASMSAGPSQALPSPHAYAHLIYPSLMPLPEGTDLNLTNPAIITKSCDHKPAAKVARFRQKTKDPKGKKCCYASDNDGDTDTEPACKRGHRKGSPNFKPDEVNKLLDLVEQYLPLGQKGWKTLIKTKKPTGDAYCPLEIQRAHQVEGLLDECTGT
ncbi:hypothetical protein B0H17DRAFT_1215653 [Mycena rosella]|uniref:Uncharacterized protein n=1 Tax=Mycena rosella TaxID=1033263 RepID=A0AAD7FXG5_MYCRO|nr:hypothetical protein B0H17DRAFT_1215653 [Mycena rosella]